MLVRFVKDSIRRSPRRKALIIAAVAMGSAVATSMLGVMLSIGDKINRELRQVGANIVVTAKASNLTGGAGDIDFLDAQYLRLLALARRPRRRDGNRRSLVQPPG